jgi:hypothetical protein
MTGDMQLNRKLRDPPDRNFRQSRAYLQSLHIASPKAGGIELFKTAPNDTVNVTTLHFTGSVNYQIRGLMEGSRCVCVCVCVCVCARVCVSVCVCKGWGGGRGGNDSRSKKVKRPVTAMPVHRPHLQPSPLNPHPTKYR